MMPTTTKKSVTAEAVAEPEVWRLKYAGPFEPANNGLFHFYDGSLYSHDGYIDIPRDRPDWAQRLLRFENFVWPDGEVPLEFLQALGYGG